MDAVEDEGQTNNVQSSWELASRNSVLPLIIKGYILMRFPQVSRDPLGPSAHPAPSNARRLYSVRSIFRIVALPCSALRRWCIKLERVSDLIIFPHPYLPPLLGLLVFHPYLLRVLCNELSDEAWIPKFTSYSKVFTAAHQSVGFAAFHGGWYAFWGEVVLFATGNGDKSINQDISTSGMKSICR